MEEGQYNCTVELIKWNANITIATNEGLFPGDILWQNNNTRQMHILLKKGAKFPNVDILFGLNVDCRYQIIILLVHAGLTDPIFIAKLFRKLYPMYSRRALIPNQMSAIFNFLTHVRPTFPTWVSTQSTLFSYYDPRELDIYSLRKNAPSLRMSCMAAVRNHLADVNPGASILPQISRLDTIIPQSVVHEMYLSKFVEPSLMMTLD